MPGDRFSFLYLQSGDPVPDSARARHRVGALFSEAAFMTHGKELAAHLGRNLGIPVPGDGHKQSHWHQFVRDCRTADFFDVVTVVYRYLFWHVNESAANWWRDAVRQIFNDENLAYQIDDAGGVHPRVDREFQRNVVSAVAGFQSERYKKDSRVDEHQLAQSQCRTSQLQASMACNIFSRGNTLGLMFPYARLTTDEVKRRLRPLVDLAYEGDATAQKAAHLILDGFEQWVESSQHYRHQPGAANSPNLRPTLRSCGSVMEHRYCGGSLGLRKLARLRHRRKSDAQGPRAHRGIFHLRVRLHAPTSFVRAS